MARSSNDLTLQVGFDIDKFNKELAKTNTSLNKWAGGITSSLKGVAAGFSAIAIGRFVLDISRLAGEAEGVSAAFKKLEGSAKLMTDLKNATGGTVSELELMKRSVMASNFDISLKALPQLLEFATLRARQTGQSVDYLVDSIVTGIGRKSKLILDNLGISAVQLTEALGGASAASSTIGEVAEAVGRIASKNLEKMGKLTDDAAVKADRLSASWANFKVTLGQFANSAGVSATIEFLDGSLKKLNSMIQGFKILDMNQLQEKMDIFNRQGGWDKDDTRFKLMEEGAKRLGVQLLVLTEDATGLQKVMIDGRKTAVNYIDGMKAPGPVIHNIKFLEESIASLNEEIKLSGSQSQIAKYQKEIEGLQEEIDKLLGKTKELFSPDASFIAGKAGALGHKSGMESMQGQAAPKIAGFSTTGIEAMQKALEKLTKISSAAQEQWDNAIKKYNENTEQMVLSAFRVSDAVGQAIGGLISGTEDFAATMKQAAKQIINQLERIALAYVIANAAKLKHPVAVAAAIAVGFGLVKGAFNQIGGEGDDSGYSRRDQKWMREQGTRAGGIANVRFVIEGDKLVGVLDNHNRVHRRTGT